MKHIKLFENFESIEDRLSDNIDTIMVELGDYGFKYKDEIYDDTVLILKIWKEDKTNFLYSEVKDYFLTIIDLYKEIISDDLDIAYEHENIAVIYGQQHFITIKSEPRDDKMVTSVDCTIYNRKKS